ncbi:hypothetical protein MCOR25_009551 [Pyricularia grisea]|nr:hypothetical protein MCOR25_009551 [Pyricularia grisea]
MSNPFSYLLDHNNTSQSLAGDLDFTAAPSATLTDSGSTYNGMDTPSTTEDGIHTPTTSHLPDNGFQGTPTSSITLAEPAGPPPPREPTAFVQPNSGGSRRRVAARWAIWTLNGMNGPYTPHQRGALRKQESLRLPWLKSTDNLTCRVTKFCAKSITYKNSAPLLWWLWSELFYYLQPTAFTKSCKLEFTPARETDITLPYTISINLAPKHGNPNIELTVICNI